MNQKISLLGARPALPLEIWEMVFNFLPIKQKLSSSKIISEFSDFYFKLLLDIPRYFAHFNDQKVEEAATLWVDRNPSFYPHNISFLLSNREILGDSSLMIYNLGLFSGNLKLPENYLSVIKISSYSSMRFKLKNLILPTGRFNLYFKAMSLCRSNAIERFYEIKICHKSGLCYTGYIDHWKHFLRKFGPSLPEKFKWVPVLETKTSEKLLTIDCCFEEEDEIEVELVATTGGVQVFMLLHLCLWIFSTYTVYVSSS